MTARPAVAEMTASAAPAIHFDNLTLGYGRHPAVHHLHGAVRRGSLTAVVGPNGAGKSTLLKGVAGAMKPLQGHIRIERGSRADIAWLPQAADVDRSFPLPVKTTRWPDAASTRATAANRSTGHRRLP